MRCWKCGAELPDGARFCYMCASPVDSGEGAKKDDAAEPAPAAEDTADAVAMGESEAEAVDDPAGEPDEGDLGEDASAEGEDLPGDEPMGEVDEALSVDEEVASGSEGGEGSPEASALDDAAEVDVHEEEAELDEPQQAAPMPAVRKLESPLPVGAVPFVPMAPSPRSTYVQRRQPRPVRSPRPGVNSAPTVASGYTNLGLDPRMSLRQDAAADDAAAAPEQSAAPDERGFAGFKSKFNHALESWTASAAARDEKKREMRAAAERVEAAGREQRAREERARQEELERAELERRAREEEAALAARVREEAAAAERKSARQDAAAPWADAERTVAVSRDGVDAGEVEGAEPAAPTVMEPEIPAFTQEDARRRRAAERARENDVTAFWERPADAPAERTAPSRPQHVAAAPAFSPEEPEPAGASIDEGSTQDLGGAFAGYHPAPRPQNKTNFPKKPLLIGIAAVFVVVCVAAAATIFAPKQQAETPTLKPAEQIAPITPSEPAPEPEQDSTDAPEVRAAVEDYSWDELSQISALISSAASDAEGLKVAEKYHLCDASGKLDGTQAKSLQLADGTTVKMRVAGFRADELADGSGKAGISFISDTSVATMALNADGAVDWSASQLCAWLEGEGAALLPSEVSQKIVDVKKTANRVSDPSLQESVEEKLWIPSYSEVAGELTSGSVRYGAYNAEGAQYQLFSDQGGTWDAPSEAFKVKGECANWWTRSADPTNSGLFIAPRNSDGGPGFARNAAISGEVGVVPGFCL